MTNRDVEATGSLRNRVRRYFTLPGVIKQSRHEYRGGVSNRPYYLDFDSIVNDPYQCEDVVRLFADTIEQITYVRHLDFLAFVEKDAGGTTGALRLSAAISIATRIPSVCIRLDKEIPWEKVKVPFYSDPLKSNDVNPKIRLAGLKAAILTDHVSEGSEALRAIKAVEYTGAKVTDIITFNSISDLTNKPQFEERDIAFSSIFISPEDPQFVGMEVELE